MPYTAVALALASQVSPSEPPLRRPIVPDNVLVIVMDDVGPELLGCYDAYFQSIGKPSGTPASTPAIDQLVAARGLMFTSAWAAPSCTPSRAQILTGRHGSRTGIGKSVRRREINTTVGLDSAQTLLPELLRHAPRSFESAALGKWHLADPDQLALDVRHPLGSPPGRWFDRYAGAMFNLVADPSLPETTTGYYSWPKLFATRVQMAVNPCASGAPPCEEFVSFPPVANYATVDTADDALDLMGELAEPWFLWVSFSAAHLPAQDVPIGMPDATCGTYAPPALPCYPGSPSTNATRARCVLESLDLQIARLMCAVDELDTTVILLGDNGTEGKVALPPYPSSHGKRSVYEGGVHVPLIVCSPELAPTLVGTTCDALVSTADLFATTCELSGVDPALVTAEDSISLAPYLRGQASGSLRTTVYAETFKPNFVPDPQTGGAPATYVGSRHEQALRNARFKLIRTAKRDAATGVIRTDEELYDLLQGGPVDLSTGLPTPDWFEQNDLLAPTQPPLSGAAAAAYATLSAQLDATFPTLVH